MAEAVYLLCAVTGLVCAGLLLRSYRSSQMKLIFWTGLCFVGLTINNILLVIDLAVVPQVDLIDWRNFTALGAVTVLLYGLISSEGL